MKTTDRRWHLFPGLFFLLLLVIVACTGQNGRQGSKEVAEAGAIQDADAEALITFDTLNHDFGTIIEGEIVVCYFDYQNTGKNDLVISSVEATCGCTTPDWKREPLKPGERENLKVVFDATGRTGSQRKAITVRSNASNSTVRLTILANINNSD